MTATSTVTTRELIVRINRRLKYPMAKASVQSPDGRWCVEPLPREFIERRPHVPSGVTAPAEWPANAAQPRVSEKPDYHVLIGLTACR